MTDINPKTIRAIGGGSVNDTWMQGITNIIGKTVETASNPPMTGFIGAAECAFVGERIFKNFKEVNSFINVRNPFKPNPDICDKYDKLFQSNKEVYTGLKEAYKNANYERFNKGN